MSQSSKSKWAEYGLTGFFALMMLAGAAGHVVQPEFYEPLIPPPIPPNLANIAATIVEGAVGVLLIVPRTRWMGAAAFCALMVAFTPLHVWDLFQENPAVGSKTAAIVRLVVQFGFIAASAWLTRSLRARKLSTS